MAGIPTATAREEPNMEMVEESVPVGTRLRKTQGSGVTITADLLLSLPLFLSVHLSVRLFVSSCATTVADWCLASKG